MKKRILNLLISLDQFLFCVVTLGKYDPDMTLSAQAWIWHKQAKRSWVYKGIDLLFRPLEKDHCYTAYQSELKRQIALLWLEGN